MLSRGNKKKDNNNKNSLVSLETTDLPPDPYRHFSVWLEDAFRANIIEPNAMSLATSSKSGDCSIRTVLLKMFDENGFVFFSDYQSTKAKAIDENPHVALLFPWLKLERQVKITGIASRISRKESLSHYLSRPRGRGKGSWINQQRSIVISRKLMELKLDEIKSRFSKGDVSVPEVWGGYLIKPVSFEFWQRKSKESNDRYIYTQNADAHWEYSQSSEC
ncbi:pyridoxamine 5'-phosphate oxidase [Litoribacillus peritrichatus]|uniref:Pyridoxamine 5'-phosphate oxidase n=1 Tax=Litoribacillus peritrichatus TaxID=718191 RepID=A0ABP7MQX7_9GAMM